MVGQQHVNLESMCKDGLRSKLNLCEQIFKSKLNTFIKSTFWSFFNFNWIHMNPQIWQNPIHNPNLPTSSNIIQHHPTSSAPSVAASADSMVGSCPCASCAGVGACVGPWFPQVWTTPQWIDQTWLTGISTGNHGYFLQICQKSTENLYLWTISYVYNIYIYQFISYITTFRYFWWLQLHHILG